MSISASACNAMLHDITDVIAARSDEISEWEAIAFMLAFTMKQMATLDDGEKLALGTYASGIAAAMSERRLN